MLRSIAPSVKHYIKPLCRKYLDGTDIAVMCSQYQHMENSLQKGWWIAIGFFHIAVLQGSHSNCCHHLYFVIMTIILYNT